MCVSVFVNCVFSLVMVDSKLEELCMKWYEEAPSDIEGEEEDSELSNAPSERSNHKTDIEQSADEKSNDQPYVQFNRVREPACAGND
ncbi:hypothetical protein QE152_g35259 [Popillia japonica]|uniref:Uncharacterized protein n=1 Tax=Popillia japonica TaxID=7064 RepID=A0AAW1IGH0_POPJA